MKKAVSIFIIIVTFGVLNVFGQPVPAKKMDQLFQKFAKVVSKACPINLESGAGKITSFDYQDKVFFMDVVFKEYPFGNFSDSSDNNYTSQKAFALSWYNIFHLAFKDGTIFKGTSITEEQIYQHFTGTKLSVLIENSKQRMEFDIPTSEIIEAGKEAYHIGENGNGNGLPNITEEDFAQNILLESNEEYPMSLGTMTIDSMRYNNKTMSYYYSMLSSKVISSNMDSIKEILAAQIKGVSSEVKLYEYLIQFNAGCEYIYFFKDIDSTLTIRFEPEELAILRNNDIDPTTSAKEALIGFCNNQTMGCPLKIDEYTILDSVTYTAKQLVFHYTVLDNPTFSFNALKKKQKQIKKLTISNMVDPSNNVFHYLVELCADADYGLKELYNNQSHTQSIEINITADEVKAAKQLMRN